MIRVKNVLEVLVVAALFAPRPALAQGDGGIVVADSAPVYVRSTGDRIEYTLRKGDRIAGVTTFGFSENFHFESKNERLHVEYVDSRGFPHTAWMRPSDLARFTYECSCDRGGLCSPWEQGRAGTWNKCFTDGAEQAVARLAPTPPPPPPTEPPAPAVAETKKKPFSNGEVVALVKAGLDDGIVIAKIEQATGADLDVSTGALVKLKKQGVSSRVIQAMVKQAGGGGQTTGGRSTQGSMNQAPIEAGTSPSLPSAYGYYVLDAARWQNIEAVQVVEKVGQRLLGAGTQGIAVDGIAGEPSVNLTTPSPIFLVYQQTITTQDLHLSKLVYVDSMKAYEFNMMNTAPQFYAGLYGQDYNAVIQVGLWRVTADLAVRVEPVEGKAGMYKITPEPSLADGMYALYFGKALHPNDIIFATSNRKQSFVIYFQIRQ